MKTIIKIYAFVLLSAVVAGCTRFDEPVIGHGGQGEQVEMALKFLVNDPNIVVSRAGSGDIMNYIDNVHVLLFGAAGLPTEDDDTIVYRTYMKYDIDQKIYLRTNTDYRIFVVANLDATNTNVNDAATFFDDVRTLGDLKAKHIVSSSRSVEQLGKLVMTTDGVIPISLPSMMSGAQVLQFIPLSRVSTKIVFNVYNRVDPSTKKVLSGVYPVTWNVGNLPRSSYLMKRDNEDYPTTAPSTEYIESVAELLPDEDTTLVKVGEGANLKAYTKQTFYLYTFENRRGSVPGLTNVYNRNSSSPARATFIQITANTTSKALVYYIHPGKGRTEESPVVDGVSNFDIDRNCVYTMNVWINSTDSVAVDSRCVPLDQHVLLTLPDMTRVDAHYLDIPCFVSGMNGYVKLESGTCETTGNGVPTIVGNVPQNYQPMSDGTADSDTNDPLRWLRISFTDPYKVTNGVKPATSLYVGLTTLDGHTGATPKLHFREFIDQPGAYGSSTDPIKRTAVIRVGYVPGVASKAEYDAKVQDTSSNEFVFYVYVSQNGLKTIGAVGGYNGTRYTSLLGVESVEENVFPYYPNINGTSKDIPNDGPYWEYRKGIVNHNQPFDGKTSTIDHYNDYRSQYPEGVPPKRNDQLYPNYTPSYNTNAADYCMRKNRDENGDGIISGAEAKWYLPTPVQLMQLSIWRDSFKYSFDYNMSTSLLVPYWSATEAGIDDAFGVDFSAIFQGSYTSNVLPYNKTVRHGIRCVRDIDGEASSGIAYETTGDTGTTGDSYLAIDLSGSVPASMLGDKTGQNANQLRLGTANSVMQKQFVLSRWYTTNGNDHNATPVIVAANKKPDCTTYAELPDYPEGSWFLPSQRELSFIYAYAGMIENVMYTSFGVGNYHPFIIENHWAITNNGSNNSTFWGMDFRTGYSEIKVKEVMGYCRCVRYVNVLLPE